MSEKAARIHTHVSNRAKIRESGEKKVVFKSVLDSPYRIQWPSVPLDVQSTVLAIVISMLDGVANYHYNHTRENRKRKRNEQERPRKRKETLLTEPPSRDMDEPTSTNETSLQQPTVVQHLIVGINEVTKRLESQIREGRLTTIASSEKQEAPIRPSLKVVLVCRADVDPPLLVDHLPHLVAAYNSIHTHKELKLVPLPKGAEQSLAQATGLRRAAVVGIDQDCPDVAILMASISCVPVLTASWLASAIPRPQFVPTHIKQVRTSAPRDMRAEKERRKEEKALAKQMRRTRTSESALKADTQGTNS